MKKYYFYLIEDDFYSLFKGDNLKAFLELFFRKEDSTYYEKQFDGTCIHPGSQWFYGRFGERYYRWL